MSDTREMKIKLKTTKWQVAGKVAIALIAAYAASVATHTATTSTSKESLDLVVNRLDTVLIPAIQKLLEEMRYDAKQDRDDATAVRERVARLEGIIETLPGRRHSKPRKTEPWGLGKALNDARKMANARSETRLPTLRMQHQQMGPSLETPIVNAKETP